MKNLIRVTLLAVSFCGITAAYAASTGAITSGDAPQTCTVHVKVASGTNVGSNTTIDSHTLVAAGIYTQDDHGNYTNIGGNTTAMFGHPGTITVYGCPDTIYVGGSDGQVATAISTIKSTDNTQKPALISTTAYKVNESGPTDITVIYPIDFKTTG